MPTAYFFDYSPVFLAALVGAGLIGSLLILSRLLAPRRKEPLKGMTYECGILPIGGHTWMQFHVRYYLFAILFLIFEVEVVFMFPWAVILQSLGNTAFVEMMLFLAILPFGLAYAWKKGVLEWER